MVGGVRLVWSVWGDDVIDRELLRFSDRAVSDMTPAYVAVVHDIKQATAEQFESEGQRAGEKWAELAPSTVAAKEAAGYEPGTILRATNLLFESLTEDEHEDQVMIIEGGNLTFGSNVYYGKFHKTGTVNMPARDPLEFTELDKVGWMKQLQRYIATGELGPGAVI